MQNELSQRQNWTEEEDDLLKKLVKKYGNKVWKFISKRMRLKFPNKNRSSKGCRERYIHYLCPFITKRNWTVEEEELLFTLQKQFGNKWTEIAKHFPGRTDAQVKNHFYATLRKALRRLQKCFGTKSCFIIHLPILASRNLDSIKPQAISMIFQEKIYQALNISREFLDFIFTFRNIKNHNLSLSFINRKYSQQFEIFFQSLQQMNDELIKEKEKNKKIPVIKAKQTNQVFRQKGNLYKLIKEQLFENKNIRGKLKLQMPIFKLFLRSKKIKKNQSNESQNQIKSSKIDITVKNQQDQQIRMKQIEFYLQPEQFEPIETLKQSFQIHQKIVCIKPSLDSKLIYQPIVHLNIDQVQENYSDIVPPFRQHEESYQSNEEIFQQITPSFGIEGIKKQFQNYFTLLNNSFNNPLFYENE